MIGVGFRALERGWVGVAAFVGLWGCERGTQPAMPAEQPVVSAPAVVEPPGTEARRALFQRLVKDIRNYHLFSDAWPVERWEAELPRLEREVVGAQDRSALLVALSRVSKSLRDGHLAFTPARGWDNPGVAVLRVTFFRTGSELEPHFVVQRAAATTGLVMGDELVRYDGIDTAALFEHFAPEIDRASPGGRLARLTELLYSRSMQTHPRIVGSAVAMRVRRGNEFFDAAPVFAPNAPPPVSTSAAPVCAAPPRDYGVSYELAHASGRLCLYRGLDARSRRYPIVRHVSFMYAGRDGTDYDDPPRRDHLSPVKQSAKIARC